MTTKLLPNTEEIQQIMGWEKTSVTAIELLHQLDQTGSINAAAKALSMSYKAAWQKLDQLGNIVPYPLFHKQTGGSGGGGSALTEDGQHLLEHIKMLEKDFNQFMSFFSDNREVALNTLKTIRRLEMKLSARNVWIGQVDFIEQGAVNSVVNIQLKGGDKICAVITDNSVGRLELVPGKEIMAIVKASNVLLGETSKEKISARNILTGTVVRIVPGAVNDEITINLSGGSTVTSIITTNSVKRLELAEGKTVSAIIKASDVLLAVV